MREQVQDEVRREHGATQTPCMNGKWQGNDLILAVSPAAPRRGLAVPKPVSASAATAAPERSKTTQREVPKSAGHRASR